MAKLLSLSPLYCRPNFSSQVTNFKCGGYSVGISCSLLLVDLLITDNFLQRWGQIQRQLISTSAAVGSNLPIFYLPNLKPNGSFTLEAFNSTQTRGQAHTLILKITRPSNESAHKAQLAELCTEEVQRAFGKTGEKISSFRVVDFKESPAVLKVKTLWPDSEGSKGEAARGGGIAVRNAMWQDLGINDLSFYAGNKPAGVACWVCWQNVDVGLVMPISDGGGASGGDVVVIVAIPDGE